ncbi:MAG: TetR/AcrR family transcriptional regulator [Bradymonadales bacterium]|nr:TetR/AcrR family transcriptional regulator [Bradymonadales bacterium]
MTARSTDRTGRRRQQILERAATLFAQLGYQKTTLEDIAKACGIGKTALYYYFPSKQEILVETIRGVVGEILEEIRRAVSSIDGAKEQVTTYLTVASRATMARLSPLIPPPEQVQEILPRFEEIWEAFLGEEIRLLAAILEGGRDREIFRITQPLVVAEALVVGFHALQFWSTRVPQAAVKQDVTGELLRLLMHGICR